MSASGADWIDAVILGIVEGLTEFLPISSTGHLLIAEHWLGQRSELFNVAIQVGAILAVTLVYRHRIADLLHLGRDRQEHGVSEQPGGVERPSIGERHDYLWKLAAAFLVTVVFGLAAQLGGAELPETITPVAVALIVGGLVIFVAEYYAQHHVPSERVTWAVVVAVGLAQVVAGIFPGTSRSAAAIFAAMFAGLTSRPRAAEFAFLVGIPTMLAATGYALFMTLAHGQVAAEPWAELVVAFVTAAVVGFASVKWLLAFISGHSFVIFAWYRLAFGLLLLLLLR
jgi:undecaprenyl-diphosphatase